MGFRDYKIRDGVHIPSDKFRENWNAIFGKKKKKKEKDPHLELFEDAPEPDTPVYENEQAVEDEKYLKELKNKL